MRQIKKYLQSKILLAVLVIPVQSQDKWEIDKYSGIPPNHVTFGPQGMNIDVKASAGPMIYPLPPKTKILGFKIIGTFHALPKFSDVKKQGEKGFDDYPLRVGLLVPGEQRLSGVRKLFAAEWVKKLFAKVPEGMGLDHVHFFNISQDPTQKGVKRVHPGSDLIHEEVIDSVEKPGPFQYEYTLTQPLEALGTWLSVDGDDTKSEYQVTISQFEFITQ